MDEASFRLCFFRLPADACTRHASGLKAYGDEYRNILVEK